MFHAGTTKRDSAYYTAGGRVLGVTARAAELATRVRRAYEGYQFHIVVQQLVNFCAVDLSALYLDIVKDRLYTAGRDSVARRSAQNALFHIAQALTRLIAPVLSLTAQEAWEALNGNAAFLVEFSNAKFFYISLT